MSGTAAGKKFGFVLFDDEADPREAWASSAGLDAVRIQGVNELATDTIWWTNLSYATMFQATNTGSNAWLRHDVYMVVKPKEVLLEWGYDPTVVTPDLASRFLSRAFGRVMQLSYQLMQECIPGIPMERVFVGKTLRNDLERLLPKAEYPQGPAATLVQSGQAYSDYTSTTVRTPRNSKRILLRRPRLAHALDMLTTPVPEGQFAYKSPMDLRLMSTDRVALLRGIEQPVMAEITVQSIDGDVAPVYGYGNSMNKDERIMRSWVTHPEFVTMASFAELNVRSAYIGTGYSLLNAQLPEPVRKFLLDRVADFSWCAGVVAETLWRAAALAEAKKRNAGGPTANKDERPGTSWRGAWLKSADKTAMFVLAMKLTEMGYPAASYGNGACWVAVMDEQVGDLMRDASTMGLLPRFLDVPQGGLSIASSWGGDKKSGMVANLVMQRQRDTLWNLDRLPLCEPEQRNALLQQLRSKR